MDAHDVIDSYVHDVARWLPLRARNDVALELRTLLTDELRERSRARAPDRDTAVALVRAFGRPSEVASRYHQPVAIIAPSDTWTFVAIAVAGALLLPPGGPGLAWIGLLVLVFGLKQVFLRRRPDALRWRPHPVRDPDRAGRAANVVAALGWTTLLVLYSAPGWTVQALTGGRVSADVLAYSSSFAHPLRMSWLVGILALAIALHLVAVVRRRWYQIARLVRLAVLLHVGIQLGWHARYGDIFADQVVDARLTPVVAAAGAVAMVLFVVALYREWDTVRPAPAAS